MNHMAHLYLSPPSIEARVGNILGDFARGVDVHSLPDQVRQGLENHRAVDAFTDKHPDVLVCKELFSKQRRRFSGVALDVLFDHYLLRHWERFSDQPRDLFIRTVYHDLYKGLDLMPPRMAQVMQRMIQDDWFTAYQELDTIGFALDRIAGRIRFPNRFEGIITEIRQHDAELEARFLAFFPSLIEFCRQRSAG